MQSISQHHALTHSFTHIHIHTCILYIHNNTDASRISILIWIRAFIRSGSNQISLYRLHTHIFFSLFLCIILTIPWSVDKKQKNLNYCVSVLFQIAQCNILCFHCFSVYVYTLKNILQKLKCFQFTLKNCLKLYLIPFSNSRGKSWMEHTMIPNMECTATSN